MKSHGAAWLTLLSALSLSGTLLQAEAAAPPDGANNSYVQHVRSERIEREAAIKSEHGVLSYVGAYLLKEGENSVGSDPGSEIRLPADSAPAQVGKFILTNGHVTFTSSAPGAVFLDGRVVSTVELTASGSHPSAGFSVGRLQLQFRLSADRQYRVFISDPQGPNFANFHGLDWYPIDADWRIEGRLVPHPNPRKITYENALGGNNIANSAGDVLFRRNGREYRLEVEQGSDGLAALFSDKTSGVSTYGGGRSLRIETQIGDAVVLDFNQAVNPPCAVNPYTACSLAPSQNRLPFEITAGEKIPRIRVKRISTAPKRIQ
jgi:uncharacterized protein (DUF1684 family)